MLWTGDVRRGAIFLAAFVLPFGLVAIGFARLPWRGRWLTWLWGGLVATALLYALVGGYQWVTRDVFWNPSVKVFNAYAPFFRVNSVFWDPSVYGRYLTVAVLASLAGILLGGVRGWRMAGLYAVVVATWLGLLISFSQSSFVALAAGIVVAASVVWGRRATRRARRAGARHARGAVRGAAAARRPRGQVALGRQPRHLAVARTSSARACASRSTHPVIGVGVGGFSREYAHRRGITGKDPKRVASHTTPVTVAAEEGIVGLALLVWLVLAALLATLRGARQGLYLARRARDRDRAAGDRRAQPVLCVVLRGPDDVGAARARRPQLPGAEEAAARAGGARPSTPRAVGARAGPHDPASALRATPRGFQAHRRKA